MDNPLISVIVPIYNSEQYLDMCVKSILGQTYENIEVVLVDDGSSDQSGEMCDQFACKDRRIIVVHHQNNKGSSAARNTGLQKATGEWIGWVDSDDWVEPNMYEELIRLCRQAEVNVAVGGWMEEFPQKTVLYKWEAEMIKDGLSALYALLEDQVMQPSMCNKLWKREMFDGIFFPEGRCCDDIAVSYRLIERADRVGCVKGAYYHYRQHGGTNAHGTALKNSADHFLSAKERYDVLTAKYPQLSVLLAVDCLVAVAFFWCNYMENPREVRREYEQTAQAMSAFSREHYEDRREFRTMGRLAKLVLPLTLHRTKAAYLTAFLFGWLYRKKRGYT